MSGHRFPPHAPFSLRILFHVALASHGCLDHCTQTYLSILAQAFSKYLFRYSFANVLIYFTLTDSLCQVFMYSKWEFQYKITCTKQF